MKSGTAEVEWLGGYSHSNNFVAILNIYDIYTVYYQGICVSALPFKSEVTGFKKTMSLHLDVPESDKKQ